jgi:hypothetical protein
MWLTVLQIPYFLAGELFKLLGKYHAFYYPSPGMFIVWLLVILAIYVPYVAQYYYCRLMIKACVRQSHPSYDFAREDGYVIVPKSLENSIGLKIGVYKEHRPEAE